MPLSAAILFHRPAGRWKRQHPKLGRGRNPLPSFRLLLAVVVQRLQCRSDKDNKRKFVSRFNVPSESAFAQPLSSFSYRSLVVSLPLLYFCIAKERRRSPESPSALAEMPSDSPLCACPTHVCFTDSRARTNPALRAGLAPCNQLFETVSSDLFTKFDTVRRCTPKILPIAL